MKCVICKVGQTHPGKTTVTLERSGVTVVFKSVPAQVCENCAEAYVGADTSRQLLAAVEEASRVGVQVDVREFVPAAR